MSEYKNISVRLNNEDYAKLEKVTDFFNANSYFKGSFADTLRIALDRMYTEIQLDAGEQEKEVKKTDKRRKAQMKKEANKQLEEIAVGVEESDVPDGQLELIEGE